MKSDTEFMSNLSSAILLKTSRSSRIIVNLLIVFMAIGIYWAHVSEIDQLTRGLGRIVPNSRVQVIQNLEGGILAQIMARPGDIVEKDQPLLKIINKKFESDLDENLGILKNLTLKSIRLNAEASEGNFKLGDDLKNYDRGILENEEALFKSHVIYLDNQVDIIKDQIDQKLSQCDDHRARTKNIKRTRSLLKKQISMTKPLVDKGIESRTNFLKLQRELSALDERLDASKLAIPRTEIAISELKKKIIDLKLSFKNRARKELTEALARMNQIRERRLNLKDQVARTMVKSPVKGIVKQLFINTIGGVIKPGMPLVEVVPVDDNLMIEARIKPSDIAFIHPDQDARVKVTAYDFSIHGGLTAQVNYIGADTVTDPRGASYYIVRLKSDKKYLGTKEKPLKIIPGMTVSVDILTGKRTILDFLLKPILKTKQNAFTER